MGLAPPWRTPTLGWLVWGAPSLSGAAPAVHLALRAGHALPVDSHGVFWLPPPTGRQTVEVLRVALAGAALCVVAAKDTPEGRLSLQRAARHAVEDALGTALPRLAALLAQPRTPPAALIRTLEALVALRGAADVWSAALDCSFAALGPAVDEAAQRVDAALTARLVA